MPMQRLVMRSSALMMAPAKCNPLVQPVYVDLDSTDTGVNIVSRAV